MDELKDLLQKNLEASEKTLKMVVKLHRALMWQRFWGVVKWTVILGLTIVTVIYVQPYLKFVLNTYTGLSNTVLNLQKNIPH